jgi:Ca2+-binding RTX toxin-like protein
MSTTAVRKRRRLGRIVGLVAALGAFLALSAGSASAGTVLCGFDAATHVVTVTMASGASVTLRVGAGDAITADGVSCGGTTSTTDSVIVFGTNAGNETVTIDETAGRFEPGFTTGETGLNEIEFYLSLGDPTPPVSPITGLPPDNDMLIVSDIQVTGAVAIGEEGDGAAIDDIDVVPAPVVPVDPGAFVPDFAPGQNLVNLNAFPADNDADVIDSGLTGESIESITVLGNGGNDNLSAKGGDGTGVTAGQLCIDTDPATPGVQSDDDESPAITLDGGAGDDFLQGSECGDRLIGGPGTDQIQGNGPSNSAGCVQNETLGQYEPAFGGLFGDIADLSGSAGPVTIVFNADGTITITPTPDDFVSGVEGVVGTAGNDTIRGNASDNFLAGGPGDDNITGNNGNDCVLGNEGNDILNENNVNADGTPAAVGATGNGADALDGGPGLEDTIDYGLRTNRTVVNLGIISWFNDGADPNADSISNECDDVFFTTENAITGEGNDILSADFLNNQSDNEFTSGNGNDQEEGGAGNDIHHQGSASNGSDALEGNSGADTADYGARTNPVIVTTGDGASNDGEVGEGDNVGGFVSSRGPAGCTEEDREILGGSILLETPAGDFTFFFFQTTGSDADEPSFGEDEPFAEQEAEDFGTVENVIGGSGNDTLVGNDSANVLTGNAGNDTLDGQQGTDSLSGGEGDDTVIGGPGNDTMDGGAGVNTADYGSSASAVNVNLTTNTSNGEGNDVLAGIVNVNGSSHNDSINGDASNNLLNGRGGNDTINGRGADDNINGGSGVDELNGNGGNDRASGGSGNDAVRGQAGEDILQGGPGADFLGGGGGNDRLSGNAGNDFLNGGAGTDTCNVGAPGLGNGDQRINCP